MSHRVRIRGIYATALTARLGDEFEVVRASEPIRERFADRDGDADGEPFPVVAEDVTVTTTRDRQGVGVHGDPAGVAAVRESLHEVSRDTFVWDDAVPRGAVFDGVVAETLGGGAVLDLGDAGDAGSAEGYLPYDRADDYVEEDDAFRVQVAEPAPPWDDDRPLLDTTLTAHGGLVELRSGASGESSASNRSNRSSRGNSARASEAARLAELLPAEPPDGWTPRWTPAADAADMDALGDALSRAVEQAETVERGFAAAGAEPAPDDSSEGGALADDVPPADELADDELTDGVPRRLVAPDATAWAWFGREGRFALDADRRAVTATMPGHHRTKAADERVSAAVDFAEAVCEPSPKGDFPFAAITRQFGPAPNDSVAIGHGKPDGRLIVLGRGEVTDYDSAGSITLRREMSPGGTYDALGAERRAGDVAVTKFAEGRWWYATVYRGADGERRGTYVNVCTPLELFPGMVRYVDLHVDVVKHADGTVERVDDDELDAAVAAGHVTEELAEKARGVASRLEEAL